jgi:hypothetical protein
MHKVLVAAAVTAAVPLAGATAASAHNHAPAFAAKVLGPVHVNRHDPSAAYVNAKYVCDAKRDAEWHLWVSLKENATGTVDPALEQEGSSEVATTWLQVHPTTFRCDGRWHEQSFKLDTTEQGKGEAIKGKGWVQFCLIDVRDPMMERAVILQDWRRVR